ncbi:MAG: hypothetical protein CM1200mP41_30570 [Gammaproteobacteria bacterium]|nr:MAG: hypothetical protein CM1200mP41_30570 [Gammaproteobacteria bacterium]
MIDHNFSTALGEIDLIMQDGSTLVFIEVRQRSQRLMAWRKKPLGIENKKKSGALPTSFFNERVRVMISSVASTFSPLTVTKPKKPFDGSNRPSDLNK